MPDEEKEPIQIISEIFQDLPDLPVCIGIVDEEGLVLVHAGDCYDIGLFQAHLAILIEAFEALKPKVTDYIPGNLNLITLEFDNDSFYLDDLTGTGVNLYLVAHSHSSELLQRAIPLIRSIVNKIEQMFMLANKPIQ